MADPERTPRAEQASPQRSFLVELKKRQVYQAAVAYFVVAWGVTEILDGVVSRLGWPDWLATLAVIVFVVGFPVAMFLAWAFDWTPEGIRREDPWTAIGWVSLVLAGVFLVAGTAGLFWLINPGGLARVERIGVAVLPCRYRGDPEFAFRGAGYARLIHERLAHLSSLHVPAFPSVQALAERNMETEALGARLGVDWLVECRVDQESDRLAFSAGLIRVEDDETQTLPELDQQAADVFLALDTMTTALVKRLGIALEARERARLTSHHTDSTRALDEWLQGRQAMEKGTAYDLQEARRHFQAAQIAGDFELARINEAQAMMALMEIMPPATDSGLAASRNAVKLILDEVEGKNPELADLYCARLRFGLLEGLGDAARLRVSERARGWFERAVELEPNAACAYRLWARHLDRAGKTSEASEARRTAGFLDPVGATREQVPSG